MKNIARQCSKCDGTGSFLNFGGCFRCEGTGRIMISAAEAARIDRTNASRDLHLEATKAARAGVVAAREWIRAHRTDESALNLMWAALHDEGLTAEGNALCAWMDARFAVAA